MDIKRVVLVHKKPAVDDAIEAHTTIGQARFVLGDDEYSALAHDADVYRDVLDRTKSKLGSYRSLEVEFDDLPTQLYEGDVIVTVGHPGLFVNVAKYALLGQPVIHINGNPDKHADLFTSTKPDSLDALLDDIDDVEIEKLQMVRATTADGQVLYALNELFVGKRDHSSAVYELCSGHQKEMQSSSGVLVSTGTGSTGWLTSYYNSAARILGFDSYEHAATELELAMPQVAFDRQAPLLHFGVREGFETPYAFTSIANGYVRAGESLSITSHMAKDGVIFSDGIQKDFLAFNEGQKVEISPADEKVNLVRYTLL